MHLAYFSASNDLSLYTEIENQCGQFTQHILASVDPSTTIREPYFTSAGVNSQELVRPCVNNGTLTGLATCEPWPECRTCWRGFSIHPSGIS